MVHRLLINEELFFAAFDDITADTDNPLNEIFVGIMRWPEYNDISRFGVLQGHQGHAPIWNFKSIYEFIHQNMITDLKRLFHGS